MSGNKTLTASQTADEAPMRGSRAALSSESEALISVVITCFNQGRFLAEAIESVLAQSYQNFQLIVIDDGSSDNTPDITQQYDAVHYVRQTNQGLPAARNAGLAISKGSYLVFLDADDRLLPDALEAGLQCFAEHPQCAFVSGDYRRIDEAGKVIKPPTQQCVEQDHYLALLRGNYVGMHAAVMYRRDTLSAAGGFCQTLPACEDYDLYLRLARLYPVHCHNIVVADYRTYVTSMSSNISVMIPTVLRVLQRQRRFIGDDSSRATAYRAGVQFWKQWYTDRFLDRFSSCWSRAEYTKLLRDAVAILRYAPKPLGTIVYHHGLRPRLPRSLLRLAAHLRKRPYDPPVGKVCFGDLGRVTPISRWFGYERGMPIDRYYVEKFLASHADDIKGRVLEIGDASYTFRFGGERVTTSDVLHVSDDNLQATIIGDLATADHIASDTFDCAIVTQTLHLIYDVRLAVATLQRILKPGGVLLITGPGISQISNDQWGESWYWSFTTQSMRRLLEECFPAKNIHVQAAGNVLAATAFLQGIATEECRSSDLDFNDRQYEVLIAARAVKPGAGNVEASSSSLPQSRP